MTKAMCVVLVYFLTLRMSIFEKIMLDDILLTCKQNITWLRQKRCNRISSEITLPRDILSTNVSNLFDSRNLSKLYTATVGTKLLLNDICLFAEFISFIFYLQVLRVRWWEIVPRWTFGQDLCIQFCSKPLVYVTYSSWSCSWFSCGEV